MSTDFRALCAELLEWAERTSSHYYKQADVIRGNYPVKPDSSPAYQPATVAPTDEEIEDLADFDEFFDRYETTDESGNEGIAWECSNSQLLAFARAVLTRWGTPANTINQED
jgi:hypothetical protein